jgi:hypothetical protein
MTVAQRRAYRKDILQRELDRAYERAARLSRTTLCRQAMLLTGSAPEQARRFHAQCKGEELPNRGCLCECHDEDRGGITAGTFEMSQDSLELLDSVFDASEAEGNTLAG